MDNLRKRHRQEKRFKAYGILSLSLSIVFLVFFLGSIIHDGWPAFFKHEINTDHKELISRKEPQPYASGWLLASDHVDMYLKGNLNKLSSDERDLVDQLKSLGSTRQQFNTGFFRNTDSREPEWAGLWGGIVGSVLTLLVCFLSAAPIGIAAALYLEEFAPRTPLTHFISVNISNLAAVPSILFGLLGLTLLIHLLGLPRPSALVGGLTLGFMVLPLIIVATRTGIRSVPKDIKEAALGLGATPLQVTFKHTLPMASPAIVTGVVLSMARALGETAPLLLIGMVAFIMDPPTSLMDPATTLPVQIYAWSRSAEVGFVENTAGAIMVLLGFLLMINGLASWLRHRLEKGLQ